MLMNPPSISCSVFISRGIISDSEPSSVSIFNPKASARSSIEFVEILMTPYNNTLELRNE